MVFQNSLIVRIEMKDAFLHRHDTNVIFGMTIIVKHLYR